MVIIQSNNPKPLSDILMELLVCPACKGDLHHSPPENGLSCHGCRLIFPIDSGIPIMLLDKATPLNEGQ